MRLYVNRYEEGVKFEVTSSGRVKLYISVPDKYKKIIEDKGVWRGCIIEGCMKPKFVTDKAVHARCHGHMLLYWRKKCRESRERRKQKNANMKMLSV